MRGGSERGGRDGHERNARRAHQRLLRAGHDDVDPPCVRFERDGSEGRDGVDDDEGASLLRGRCKRLHVRDHAGGRLRVDEVDGAHVPGFPQRGAQILGLGRLAPVELDVDEVDAVRLRHRSPALAEASRRDDHRAVPRRRQVRDRGLERAGARGREQQDVVLSPVHLAEPREAPFVRLAEVAAAVMDDRFGERRQHLRRDGCRPRGEQMTLLRHSL